MPKTITNNIWEADKVIQTDRITLQELGWNETLQQEFDSINNGYKIGRVAIEHKNMYRLYTCDGEILASISGKMKHNAIGREDYPAVGDWVIIDKTRQEEGNAVIHGILSRKSKFSRKVAGNETEEQIIAVNVDTLFICMSLNNDFNIRRLERYLIMAWDSESAPVVLLTKADLCDEIDRKIKEIESVAFGVTVHVISSKNKTGVDELAQYISKGKTVAFLGSSGVGKSTLINLIIGEERLLTQEIREDDDKGKHTTTHRELILLPDGGLVIDTPGMREFHILDSSVGLESTFDDIEELALACKFNDCSHMNEPGCAVQRAIKEGALTEKRFNSYIKLKKEAEFIARKGNKKAQASHKKEMKKFFNSVKNAKKI